MDDAHGFLQTLAVVLCVAAVTTVLFQRLKQPVVLGYLLAGMVGLVQGGVQALSRSLFSTMIPRERSSEMFALFGVFEKFAGIFGPALFAASVSLFQSSRAAVLSIILFFVAGAIVLWFVDVEAGEAAARREPAMNSR